ncbi:GFA family protein [Croceicoccus bisphenolivorans]|uniref:GFA family protein n=1 Tax=Croceicoccus bisphenolivorans TaxID=1783232 RepID=UPI00082A46AA|nr:GFA family protein [Croceicoccus bisphenolivorans]
MSGYDGAGYEGARYEGGCQCGHVRYRLDDEPFAVHCCHCRTCQRESGSAFALNGLIEADRLTILAGEPVRVETPSDSGKGQFIARCPQCQVALWSHYGGMGEKGSFVRIGTLDNPDAFAPDIHIFTRSKQPWVVIAEQANVREVFYSQTDYDALFGEARAARYRALRGL